MNFWKMNGAGNDFIIFNNLDGSVPFKKWPEIAKTVCERHLSIGADGIMVVERPDEGFDADYKMYYFNSDGSLGEMCGNGARCICRYGFENSLAGEIQKVQTTAGMVYGQRIDRRMYKIRLNDPSAVLLSQKAEVDGAFYEYDYMELGNPGIPHISVKIKDLDIFPLEKLKELGRKLRFYEKFPKGANVNFYEIHSPDLIHEITFERGVEDFTYACGTGTGATVCALTLRGDVTGKAVKVVVPGGELAVDINRDGKTIEDIFLTGMTNIVAKGEVTDETLE